MSFSRCILAASLAIFCVPLVTKTSLAAPIAAPQAGALTDFIDFSEAQSQTRHEVATVGQVKSEISGDWIGNHDMRRAARVASGVGSTLSWRFAVRPNVPLTLEFEEIDDRRAQTDKTAAVRGYSLWVEGKRAYFRTAPNSGAGPLHFFVSLPPQNKSQISVRLQNEGETPFRIARTWVYSDFTSYFARGEMDVPYYLAPTYRLTANYQNDLRKLEGLKTSLGTHPHARAAWTTWLPYANMTDSEIETHLDKILSLSETLDLPVQICVDTWWGATPNGSDGLGGFWGDVAYQQVVFNASTQQYGLSVPNRWGNTPWLSVGNARLNAFKTARLQFAMRSVEKKRRELRLRGKSHLILALNLDNEPVYWATGNAGLGNDILWADFGADSIESARRDGVALDPRDGLSFEERAWLRRHLLLYNQLIADAAQGAAREAIVVAGERIDNRGDDLRDNIYTQAMVANPALQFPMQNANYPLWETAAPSGVRVGSEWNGDSIREREAVTRTLPLGRSAQVNAETSGRVEENVGVRPAYGLGMRFYALYNYPLDQLGTAASAIRDTSSALPAPLYEPITREETFEGDWEARATETQGLQRGIIGNTTAMAVYPNAQTRVGHLTYRLDAPPNGFEGARLELSGRAFVSRAKSDEVFIRVLAGTENDPAKMREIGRIFDDGDINAVHRFDLSDVARGQKSVWTRIELHAGQLPEGVLSWCSIYQLRFTQGWPQNLTQDSAMEPTLETQRAQNLLVSWRRDAELALARLQTALARNQDFALKAVAQSELENARRAYDAGDYARGFRLANQTENWLPGATYHVASSGQLKPYPLTISSTAPLDLTLAAWNQSEIRLEIDAKTAAQLQIGGLVAGKDYVAVPQGKFWQIRLATAQDAPQMPRWKADQAGEIRWTAPVALAPAAPVLRLRGTVRGIEITPPAVIFWREDGNGNQRVALAPDTSIRRGETGKETSTALEKLQRGDALEVQLGEDGLAAQLLARTRTLGGEIEEIGQLTPFAMPFVRLRGETSRHVVDLSAPLSLLDDQGKKLETNFKAMALGSVPLRVGDRVKLRVHPETGRVFALALD